VAPRVNPEDLRAIFEHKVFRMLLSKGKITQDSVDMLRSWRHSGFQVYIGPKIQPGEEDAIENLARYIIWASFSQERMTYLHNESKVIYESKACPRRRSGNGKSLRPWSDWPPWAAMYRTRGNRL
jgi:hypothetical protein